MRLFGTVRTLGKAFLVLALATGCSSPISKSVRKETKPEISFRQLRQSPKDHMAEMVLLGGEIIRTRNTTQGTLLYVLEKELDYRGKPRKDDKSGGRFVVQHPGFLDPVIYGAGRLLTVAGRVMGEQKEKIDEVDYTYPVLHAEEIHLWPDEPERGEYMFYPYYYYHYPWGPGGWILPAWR